jgi:hypothetical protein
MPRLQDIEYFIKRNADRWKLQMERIGWQSLLVDVYRAVENTYSSVYGRDSGEEGTERVAENLDCLVLGDDFFPSDSHSSGTFQEGWMITASDKVRVGDLVDIKRSSDTGTRRYKVTAFQSIGTTLVIFRKYRLSALGD